MIHCWYLFSIFLEASVTMDADLTSSEMFYCDFLYKYRVDCERSNKLSWWWFNWYNYTRESTSNNIIFGTRVLFHPSITHDHH